MHHVKDVSFLCGPGVIYTFRLLLNPSPNMDQLSYFFLITELHRDATVVLTSLNLQFRTSSICINRHIINLYQHARDSCSTSVRATAIRSCVASSLCVGEHRQVGQGEGLWGTDIVQPRPFVFFNLSQEISSTSSFFFSSSPSSALGFISHIFYSSTGSRRQGGR